MRTLEPWWWWSGKRKSGVPVSRLKVPPPPSALQSQGVDSAPRTLVRGGAPQDEATGLGKEGVGTSPRPTTGHSCSKWL